MMERGPAPQCVDFTVVIRTSGKMKRKYEDHFEFTKTGAKCKICGKNYASASTSNCGLAYHLKNKHQIDVKAEEPVPAKKQNVITDFMPRKISMPERIANEACMGASFNYLANSPLVKKGLEACGFQAPSSVNTVSSMVGQFARDTKEHLKETLQKLASAGVRFGVVTDEWTCGPKKERIIAVSLHRKGHNTDLGMIPIEGDGRMNATQLLAELKKKVAEFGLDWEKHITGIASDGCSMMIKLGKDSKINYQLCLAHCLHLVVTKQLYKKKSSAADEANEEDDKDNESEFRGDDVIHHVVDVSDDEDGEEEDDDEDGEVEGVLDKLHRAINTVNRRPAKVAVLRSEVAKSQKEEGQKVIEMDLKSDMKTRWNTIVDMIDSVMRIEKVFFSIVGELSNVSFSDEEIQLLKDIRAALGPFKTLSERICSEGSTLVQADIGFQTLSKFLQRQDSALSRRLESALREEYKKRRNGDLVSLLRFLENPDSLAKTEHDPLFKMPAKQVLESQAKKLMKRLFSDVSTDDDTPSDDGDGVIDDKDSFEALFREEEKKSKGGSAAGKPDVTKSIANEMKAFAQSKKRSPNLENLYNALNNLPPTSVSCERTFSIAGFLVNKRRARLSNEKVDNLIFLRSYFQNLKK